MKKAILFILLSCASYSINAQGIIEEGDFSAELGYVNKQFVTNFGDGEVLHENLFGQEGKFLHGFQLGMFYHPTFKVANNFGIGLRTGLAYEQYLSSGRAMGYNKFSEGDLYIPINSTICFPFCDDEAEIAIHAGVNMNCVIYGKLSDADWFSSSVLDYFSDRYYWRYWRNRYERMEYLNYGEDGWPKRVNFACEFGLSFRFRNFYLRGTYSRGITNHCFYWENGQRYKTRERKLTVTLGYVF
ncbi:MAG: hypothetical protein J6W52_08875 [Bacteroidaceae bacterium]|nr:hypothetical protein [Bacteroidaceae bacterium]